ncbi:transposase [Sedimentibacter sp. zth1]|nr:transposase [Sedimentibacter sp. zth1]QSX06694.1 transposase [Sedimentibacter sp. zth1]
MSSIYKNKILEILKEIREELEFCIIAYCIMDNHMHLLIKIR